jgi:cytoskeleton protein RodZ
MTELSDAAGPAERTPGAILAAARVAAGLTQADVAGQMRISLRQVMAIESDRYDALPGAVFVRGFVRNYARLLTIDPEPLLRALEPALGGDTPLRAQHYEGPMPEPRSGRARIWLTVFLVLLLVVLGAAAYEYWRTRGASPDVAPAGKLLDPLPGAASSSAPSAPSTAAEPVPLAPERLVDSAPAAVDANSAAPPVAAPQAAEVPPAAAARSGLRIRFLEDAWVEVRAKDGKVLLSGTGQAGSERAVDAPLPLELVVGNASGVRITYNQQPVDVEARAARNIARFTLQ